MVWIISRGVSLPMRPLADFLTGLLLVLLSRLLVDRSRRLWMLALSASDSLFILLVSSRWAPLEGPWVPSRYFFVLTGKFILEFLKSFLCAVYSALRCCEPRFFFSFLVFLFMFLCFSSHPFNLSIRQFRWSSDPYRLSFRVPRSFGQKHSLIRSINVKWDLDLGNPSWRWRIPSRWNRPRLLLSAPSVVLPAGCWSRHWSDCPQLWKTPSFPCRKRWCFGRPTMLRTAKSFTLKVNGVTSRRTISFSDFHLRAHQLESRRPIAYTSIPGQPLVSFSV